MILAGTATEYFDVREERLRAGRLILIRSIPRHYAASRDVRHGLVRLVSVSDAIEFNRDIAAGQSQHRKLLRSVRLRRLEDRAVNNQVAVVGQNDWAIYR